MTLKTLDKVLGDHGVHLIEALGQPFDPAYHQAMSQVESEEEAGIVLKVVQAGFMIQDRLLRPAMVIVAR
jgi:molecular chaperone GrpE